ncbi:hypothetical protein L1887_51970 [Cichorium endivia]|nr:hypothetical protein L1887_51970 [Cichorium endivia]
MLSADHSGWCKFRVGTDDSLSGSSSLVLKVLQRQTVGLAELAPAAADGRGGRHCWGKSSGPDRTGLPIDQAAFSGKHQAGNGHAVSISSMQRRFAGCRSRVAVRTEAIVIGQADASRRLRNFEQRVQMKRGKEAQLLLSSIKGWESLRSKRSESQSFELDKLWSRGFYGAFGASAELREVGVARQEQAAVN